MTVTALEVAIVVVLTGLLGFPALVAYGYYRTRKAEPDSQNVWDLIPDWQYSGLHIESGGLTRDEQERAIREIQERAAELEGERDRSVQAEDRNSPPDER